MSDAASVLANCRRLGGCHWVPAPVLICRRVQADWESQFVLLGSILGFALLHGEQLPIKFSRNLVHLLLCHDTGLPLGTLNAQGCSFNETLDALLAKLEVEDKILSYGKRI